MSKWKFLEDIANENGLTQKDLAKTLNWQQTRISDLFADKISIPAKRVYDFASFFGFDFKELKDYNDGLSNKIPKRTSDIIVSDVIKIDILDVKACCGNGIENWSENVIGQQMMTLPALRELTAAAPENIKIIKAIGDSMIPTINPDDMVWVDVSFNHPSSDGLYLLCVGNDLLIKRIQINPFDNSAEIKSDNPQYTGFKYNNFENINVIGRIIYHIRKVG